MTLQSGSRLGPYQIVSAIGAGGMGEVWRARDSRIGRDIALKVLPASFASDDERLRRFEQEAKTAGSLNHPNLVTLYELGTSEGSPFIAMELLEGETLRDKLAHPLPYRKAIEYAAQLANGLAAAHEKAIVHRDLKPENIFITKDGRLKILDFGLAKLRIARADDDERTQQKDTKAGTILGTPGYMSPEQVRGAATDHRSDIFSFGAILYEMFTGRSAFRRDSSVETMNAVLHDDPPEISASGSQPIAPAVERIVRRCLEKNVDERFQSARDLGFALDAMSSSSISGERAAAPPSHSRRWNLASIAIVTAIAAAAAGAFVATWIGRRAKPAPIRSPLFSQLTFDSGIETRPSMSPDAKTFVFVKGYAPHRQIFLQRIDGRSAIALSKSADDDDHEPAFSPDGNQIAFRSEHDGGGIFVMGATGESVRRLTSDGHDPSWSPDGNEIVFASEEITDPASRGTISSLSIVNVATGVTRKLFAGDAVQPVISPHRKRIVYWALPPHGAQRDIYTIAMSGDPKSIVRATDDPPLDWNPLWAPDGKSIFFVSDRGGTMNLWRLAIDEETGKPLGDPEPIGAPSTRAGFASVSRDGRHLLYTSTTETTELRRGTFDPATEKMVVDPKPAFGGSMPVRNFEPSPDGKWIAFSTQGRQEDVYVMHADGGELRQLTNDTARDRGVSWTPDSSRVFFYSSREGEYDVWSVRVDGSALTRQTKGAEGNYPAVSPDGRRVAFLAIARGGMIANLGAEPQTKSEAIPPIDADDYFWPIGWSLDGTKLVGFPWGKDEATFVIYSFTDHSLHPVGGRVRPSGDGSVARWLDGRRILFATQDEVFVFDTETNTRRAVAKLEDVRLSVNGRFFATRTRQIEEDVWQMTLGDDATAKH